VTLTAARFFALDVTRSPAGGLVLLAARRLLHCNIGELWCFGRQGMTRAAGDGRAIFTFRVPGVLEVVIAAGRPRRMAENDRFAGGSVTILAASELLTGLMCVAGIAFGVCGEGFGRDTGSACVAESAIGTRVGAMREGAYAELMQLRGERQYAGLARCVENLVCRVAGSAQRFRG